MSTDQGKSGWEWDTSSIVLFLLYKCSSCGIASFLCCIGHLIVSCIILNDQIKNCGAANQRVRQIVHYDVLWYSLIPLQYSSLEVQKLNFV